MPPRFIATDLDGTLLRDDRSVSPRTAAAIRACRDRGIVMAAVTARPPRVFDEFTELRDLLDLAICSNGALVYTFDEPRRVHFRGAMSVPVARKACAALIAAIPGVTLAVETGFVVVGERSYVRTDRIGEARVVVDSIEDALVEADQIAKLLAHVPGGDADEMLAAATSAELGDVVVSHSGGRGLLEIAAAGVSKSITLGQVCVERGLGASDVIAFGDMPNDADMLRWATTSYAMANAHPAAKAAATDVTSSNEEDGVAIVLERILGHHT
ncbi:HAD hydrolase family protein [Stackebrandtia soli]|uniref:HAD hydrolase family protein n=1 Tax=Stackebrandtia soli TaxID=1892856 RepID=UPI0039EA9B2F